MLNLCNLHQILNVLKKKIILVGYAFSELPTVKGTVTQIAPCHSTFSRSHVKRCKALSKSRWKYFYKISFSLWVKLTWESSLLLLFKLLQVFIQTLTTSHKYSLCCIWNLQGLYQMTLSKKVKTFSQFFSPFLKSSSSFENFEEKDDIHSQCISEIIDSQRYG